MNQILIVFLLRYSFVINYLHINHYESVIIITIINFIIFFCV